MSIHAQANGSEPDALDAVAVVRTVTLPVNGANSTTTSYRLAGVADCVSTEPVPSSTSRSRFGRLAVVTSGRFHAIAMR